MVSVCRWGYDTGCQGGGGINRIFMLCNYACRIADALYVVLDRYCSANIAVLYCSAMNVVRFFRSAPVCLYKAVLCKHGFIEFTFILSIDGAAGKLLPHQVALSELVVFRIKSTMMKGYSCYDIVKF